MKIYYRKTFKIGLIFLVSWAILSAGIARADAPTISTGIGFMEICESKETHFVWACLSYIEGWRYGFFAARYKGGGTHQSEFNLPAEATYDQIKMVVLKYLHAHPEELHKASYWLIKDALVEAFPWENKHKLGVQGFLN